MNTEQKTKEELIHDVQKLEVELANRNDAISQLQKIIELYDHGQEITRNELMDAKETISAHNNLIHLTSRERQDARHTMDAFKNLQDLTQEELLHKNNTLQKILRINNEITSIPKKEVLLANILDSILPVLKATRGVLFLGKKNHFTPKYFKNITKTEIFSDNFSGSLSALKDSVKKKQVILLPVNGSKYDSTNHGKANAIICAPLKKGDEVLGILYLDSTEEFASFSLQDCETLEIFTAQAAIAIQNSNLYYGLEKEVLIRTKKLRDAYRKIHNLYDEIEKDLTLAKRVQDTLLSQRYEKPDNIAVNIKYKPMSRIGGDIYDISRVGENSLRILLADATGHGIQAALVTMLIKGIYDKLKRENLPVNELLAKIGEEFFHYSSLNAFFSAIVIDINWKENKISFSSAGHPEQILFQDGKIVLLKSTGRMVGVIKDVIYRVETYNFFPGDKILLYTDGLTEEFNVSDEEFGAIKFNEFLSQFSQSSGLELMDSLLSELTSFMAGKKLDDDLCMLTIDYLK